MKGRNDKRRKVWLKGKDEGRKNEGEEQKKERRRKEFIAKEEGWNDARLKNKERSHEWKEAMVVGKIDGRIHEGRKDGGGVTGWRRCVRILTASHSGGGEVLELRVKQKTESLSNHSTLST